MIAILILLGFSAVAYGKYSSTAFDYHKSRIGFGFAGVGFFLASNYLIQIIVGLIVGFTNPDAVGNLSIILFILLISYVVALILTIWIILPAFRKSWEKKQGANNLLDR